MIHPMLRIRMGIRLAWMLALLTGGLLALEGWQGAAFAGPREELTARGYAFTAGEFVRSAGRKNQAVVRLFLEAGMDIAEPDREGYTALSKAADRGDRKMVKFLLKQGADPNDTSASETSATPPAMELAARNGDLAMMRLLLDNGAEPNQKWRAGKVGGSVLFAAVVTGKPKLVELLLERGADPNQSFHTLWSPTSEMTITSLTIARDRGYKEIAHLLARAGGKDPVVPNILAGVTDPLGRVLDPDDLKEAGKAELRVIRNTILARYGYPFKSEDLREHFARHYWYRRGDRQAAITKLNTVDKKNIALIQKLEKAK